MPTEPTEAELDEALARAIQATGLRPSDARAYAEAGLMLDRARKPREAVSFLRSAVQLAPRRAAHYDELGLVLRRAALSVDSHVEHGRQQFSQSPPVRVPGDDDPCWRQPEPTCFELQFYSREQLHIAEEDFLRRTGNDETDWHGFSLLAMYYRNRSVDACVTSLKLDPTRATAYITLARTLPRGGAVGLYRRALTLLPTRAPLYRELGGLLGELRYYGQANDAFRASIELEPSNDAGYVSLADLRLQRHRSEEAIELAQQSLALHPEAPDPPTSCDPKAAREASPPATSTASSSASVFSVLGGWFGGDDADTSPGDKSAKSAARRARRAAKEARAAAARAAASPKALAISAAISLMAEGRCQQGRWDEAASLARSAIAITPASVRGYRQLSHALYEQIEAARFSMPYEAHSQRIWEDGMAGGEAIAAGEAAAKLSPRHADTRFRTGLMLRRVPGRLQDAINHFNGCILANESHPGVREAQEEAVGRMRKLQKPPRGRWWDVVSNLIPAIVLMLALSHFLLR